MVSFIMERKILISRSSLATGKSCRASKRLVLVRRSFQIDLPCLLLCSFLNISPCFTGRVAPAAATYTVPLFRTPKEVTLKHEPYTLIWPLWFSQLARTLGSRAKIPGLRFYPLLTVRPQANYFLCLSSCTCDTGIVIPRSQGRCEFKGLEYTL